MTRLGKAGQLRSSSMGRTWLPALYWLFALGAVGVSLMAQQRRPAVPVADIAESKDLRIARARLRIFAILDSPADLCVDKMPLSEFVRLLSQRHGIPFTLDPAGLRRNGVRPNATVSANVKNVALEMGLRKALKPLHLRSVATADGVVISDWDWINSHKTRTELLETVKPQLVIELAFVRNVCAPTVDQLRNISDDLPKRVIEAFDRLGSLSCDEVSETLADAVAKHLSKEQAARYRDEIEKRRRQECEACVEIFVAALDQKMHLTEQQREKLAATLAPHWNPAWTQTVEVDLEMGRDVPAIPDNLIVPVLDGEQVKIWQRLPKNGTAHPEFDSVRIGSIGMPVLQPENP
jgi:hypothetical protein